MSSTIRQSLTFIAFIVKTGQQNRDYCTLTWLTLIFTQTHIFQSSPKLPASILKQPSCSRSWSTGEKICHCRISAHCSLWCMKTPHEGLLTTVQRCKLQWHGHVSHLSGLAKTILQGTVKGGRRQGRQRKRWEDNIREWTGLEFTKSQRAVENRGNGGNWFWNHLWCPNDPHA